MKRRILCCIFCLSFILTQTMPVHATETIQFDEQTYYGTHFSSPYFYRVNNGEVIVTDCLTNVHGDLVLPETICNMPVVAIDDYAFAKCSGLTRVSVPNRIRSLGEGVFDQCKADLILCAYPESEAEKYAKEHAISTAFPTLCGDANRSADVDGNDLVLLAKYLAGWDVHLFPVESDLNDDALINGGDLVGLAKRLAGWSEPVSIYIIGDSTACEYSDYEYYRPLGGYGEYLGEYLSDQVKVVNLASSGASSKDYATREPYLQLRNSIQAGDYLFIGLGINDNKSNDDTRYTNPNGSKEDPGSYPFYLYHYYIKLALDAGATPILVTPVCRRPQNGTTFANTDVHITSDKNGKPGGDYPQAMRMLGQELGLTVLDMTKASQELHLSLGAEKNALLHKWEENDLSTLDSTHYSIYGARYIAYLLAGKIKAQIPSLAGEVSDDIAPPSEEVYSERIVTTEEPSVFTYSDGSTSLSHDTSIRSDSYSVPDGEALVKVYLADGVRVLHKEVFSGQGELTEVRLPDSLIAVGIGAFFNCKKLKLESFPPNLECIHYNSFYNCASITPSYIPSTVKELGASAFRGCKSITRMTVDAALTDKIGSNVFRDCTALTSITLPARLTKFSENMFYSCSSLKTITVPDGLLSIEKNALRSTALTSLTLPETLETIGDYPFYGTAALKTLTFRGTCKQWLAVQKGTNWKYSAKFTKIVCMDGTVSPAGVVTPA